MAIKNIKVTSQKQSSNHIVQVNQKTITIDQQKFDISLIKNNAGKVSFTVNGKLYRAYVKNNSVILHSKSYTVCSNKTTFEKSEEKPNNILQSPLAGRVIKNHVLPNQYVKKNQELLVIESMKMENDIRAQADGLIKTISISEGDLVQSNQVLITFELKENSIGGTNEENENR